jgi:hypothetical protein
LPHGGIQFPPQKTGRCIRATPAFDGNPLDSINAIGGELEKVSQRFKGQQSGEGGLFRLHPTVKQMPVLVISPQLQAIAMNGEQHHVVVHPIGGLEV